MDIDIDFRNRQEALDLLRHIPASRKPGDQLVEHNTGVYLHAVPVDAPTGLCALPFRQAEQQGWFKIDFLNVGIYKHVRNEQHLVDLLNQEPVWEFLQDEGFVSLLFHVNAHADVLRAMKPTSIPQLAAVIAMIRPAKRYLVGKSWDEVWDNIWTTPDDESYFFKKSHAHAYAAAVVVQMNSICEQISYGYS